MTEIIIKAGEGVDRIGDIKSLNGDLPDNCRLNKVTTGCGGTTVALTNEVPYVIVVPFVALIKSKLDWIAKENHDRLWNPEKKHLPQLQLQPVYGSVPTQTLKSYDGNKWMCTYDSLPRVMEHIDPSKYKLLVDESHKLIDSGDFRGNAVRKVLDNFPKFKSHVFMTATPIHDDLQYDELVKVPRVKIEWSDIQQVEVKFTQLTKSEKALDISMSKLCIEHLEGTRKGNIHIFLNSVKSIARIAFMVSHGGESTGACNPEDINIVTADNSTNREILKRHKLVIGSTSTPKKVNLYTSTAFEGCDVYDKEGVVYVACYGNKHNTKINLMTTLPQIVGRIRDLETNKNKINLIFTPNNFFCGTTESEFKAQVQVNLDEAKVIAEDLNKYYVTKNKLGLKLNLKYALGNPYFVKVEDSDTEIIRVNEQAMKAAVFKFRTIHSTYWVKDGETKAESKETINDIPYEYTLKGLDLESTSLDKLKTLQKPDFQALAYKYATERAEYESKVMTVLMPMPDNLTRIENLYPEIKKYYEELGVERMSALQYRKGRMKKELVIKSQLSDANKIIKLLAYGVGSFKTLSEIKADVQEVYNELSIDKKAKAVDVHDWYDVKPSMRTIDGKRTKGFTIVHLKPIV